MDKKLKLPAMPSAVRVINDAELKRLKRLNGALWCTRAQVCHTCQGQGWFRSKVGDEIVEYECNCTEQMLMSLWFANAGLGDEQQRASWDQLKSIDLDAAEAAALYAQDCENNMARGRGLFLIGKEYGTGKTLLTTLVLKWFMAHGFDAQFFLFPSLLSAFSDGWDNPEDKDWFRQRAISSPFLVIDDIGKEADSRRNTAIMEAFEMVVQSRANQGLPTILSTNLTLDQVKNRYGGHILSRLAGYSEVIEMGGTDFRPEHDKIKGENVENGLVSPVRWK